MRTMKRPPTFVFRATLFAFLAIAMSAQAAKIEVECPEEIKTKQAIEAAPKGWESLSETAVNRQIFTGLQIYDGHPKNGAQIFEAPPTTDAAGVKAAADSATPPIESIFQIPEGREAYVTCYYTGTLVRVTKKLPKGTRTCRVKFSETLGHVQKAICE